MAFPIFRSAVNLMRAPFVLITATAVTVFRCASGYQLGAGRCSAGQAAVGWGHFEADDVRTGQLADVGLDLQLNGVAMDANSVTDFIAGQDHTLIVTGESNFKGILIRLGAPSGVDTTDSLVAGANVQEAFVCQSPDVGVTHFNNAWKAGVFATLHFEEPVSDIVIDVTVVIQNSGTISEFYYTGFRMNAVLSRPTVSPASEPILERIMTEEDLSTLDSALSVSGLLEELSETNPLTVFGPVDMAFETLDPSQIQDLFLPGAEYHMQEFLLLHMVNNNTLSSDLVDGSNIEMLNYQKLEVGVVDGEIYLQDSLFGSVKVIEADIAASNGVLHKVDGVMLPAFFFTDLIDGYAAESATFSTFLSLAVSTVMHAVKMRTPSIRLTDLPDSPLNLQAATGLEEEMRTELLTLFVPTNDAFLTTVPNTTALLADDPDLLRSILLYHAVPGLYPSNMLSDGQTLGTVEGSSLTVSTADDIGSSKLRVNGALVLFSDGLARNGLAYVIDSVLLISTEPSAIPSGLATSTPSTKPSVAPIKSGISVSPSLPPSQLLGEPSTVPSAIPSGQATSTPSTKPSVAPSLTPIRLSAEPSALPTGPTSSSPSTETSAMPTSSTSPSTSDPSSTPSLTESDLPTSLLSTEPSASVHPTSATPTTQQPDPTVSPSLPASTAPALAVSWVALWTLATLLV